VSLNGFNMNADLMPIPNRLRPDLEWSPYDSDRSDTWIARDPVRREFYFFSTLEKAIALCLDGKASVQRIVQKVRRIDDSVSGSFVRNLIRRLEQASLLLNSKWRQTDSRLHSKTNRWLGQIVSWMAWRVPLLDPSKVIDFLEPAGKLFFGRTVLSLGLGAVLVCSLLLANRWSDFVADFETLQFGLRGDRYLFAVLLLLGIKALHEFGHAIACRSAGAECREMGVFFFFLAPCMYCDVSDIWRVPSRWKRIMVSAAGITTEIAITLIAFAVWYTSGVPWVRGVAVQVMLLCSVLTILVNANPLLRYDGYYILSDALRIPNMADQAREAWSQLWRSWLFGTRTTGSGLRSVALASYQLASSIYRWFLLAVLIWGANNWLLQQRLGGFAAILSAVIGTAILANIWSTVRSSQRQNDSGEPIRWLRLAFCLTAIATLIWIGGTWNFKQNLFARGVLEPSSQASLFARQAGTVSQVALDGVTVRPEEILVTIESPELELQRLQCSGDLSVATVRLRQAASRSVDDPLASRQLAELEETVQAIEKRLEKFNEETVLLQLRSHSAGIFVDSILDQTKTEISGRSIGQSVRLGVLSKDRPFVERGQTLGEVVSTESWQVRAFVNELDIDQCQIGAKTLVRLDQLPGVTFHGRVASILEDRLERSPSKLVGDTLFASTLANTGGDRKPEQTTYSMMVEIDVKDCKPIANGLASVQIEVDEKTMFVRLREMLQRTWGIKTQ